MAVLCAVLAGLLPSTSQAQSPEPVDSSAAETHERTGIDCANAQGCLDEALALREDDREVEALAVLDQLIAEHPRRLRARAERALSLYRLGRMQDSVAEVDALLENTLPPNVRANLLALRAEARLQQASRSATRYGLRLALGHDDNVATFADYDPRPQGPGPTIGTFGGSPDEYAEAAARLRWRGIGFGHLHGLADVDLNLRRYHRRSEFDLDDLRLRGGLDWRPGGAYSLTLLPTLRHIRRDDRALLSDGGIEAALEYRPSPWLLRLGLERNFRRYDGSRYDSLDATHWGGNLRAQGLFGSEPQWWLGTDLEYREESARNPAQSRDLQRVGLFGGVSRGRHELQAALDGNRYRYATNALPPIVLPPDPLTGAGGDTIVIGASDLRYRGAELRYRFNFSARFGLQLRLRRLLADVADGGPRYERTSLDIGIEWNR